VYLSLFIAAASIFGAVVVLLADLHRRRLTLTRSSGWRVLSVLDVLSLAVTAGAVLGLLMALVPSAISRRVLPLDSSAVWAALAGIVIAVVLWSEGRQQMRFQRPWGIIFGEWLVLVGVCLFLVTALFNPSPFVPQGLTLKILCILAVVAGGALIAVVVIPFMRRYEGLRILDRFPEQGESVQTEYTPPTPECPHPELWRMLDSQTTEVEVIDFLKSLVTTVKPNLVVETGTFLAYSTIKMAEGLRENGFGKIITIESDPAIFAKAKERIDASGLGQWIEYRNESSMETQIDGTIDILFSDSHMRGREQEIRRFLPWVKPRGLILIHDASSHFQIVREAALRLEQEGLISVVLLPTPRGLVIAQRREGRE